MNILRLTFFTLCLIGIVFTWSLSAMRSESQFFISWEYKHSDPTQPTLVENSELEWIVKEHIHYQDSFIGATQLQVVEQAIEQNPFVRRAECWKTLDGKYKVEVFQKSAKLRIQRKEREYYLDHYGEAFPLHSKFPLYSPLVRCEGETSDAEIQGLVNMLGDREALDAFIADIYINSKEEITFVPALGSFVISMGTKDHFEKKLDDLSLFYEQVLKGQRWDLYSKVDLSFENQIICSKRDTL